MGSSLVNLSNIQFDITARIEDCEFGRLSEGEKRGVAAFFHALAEGLQTGTLKDASVELSNGKLLNALKHAADTTGMADVQFDAKKRRLTIKQKTAAPTRAPSPGTAPTPSRGA